MPPTQLVPPARPDGAGRRRPEQVQVQLDSAGGRPRPSLLLRQDGLWLVREAQCITPARRAGEEAMVEVWEISAARAPGAAQGRYALVRDSGDQWWCHEGTR